MTTTKEYASIDEIFKMRYPHMDAERARLVGTSCAWTAEDDRLASAWRLTEATHYAAFPLAELDSKKIENPILPINVNAIWDDIKETLLEKMNHEFNLEMNDLYDVGLCQEILPRLYEGPIPDDYTDKIDMQTKLAHVEKAFAVLEAQARSEPVLKRQKELVDTFTAAYNNFVEMKKLFDTYLFIDSITV